MPKKEETIAAEAKAQAKAEQVKKARKRKMTAAERRAAIQALAAFQNFRDGEGRVAIRDEGDPDAFPRFRTLEQFKEERRTL
jgi:hypothetical protein